MKTTKQDFDLFKRHCNYFIDLFGLKNWYIEYAYELLEDKESMVSAMLYSRTGKITLSTELDSDRSNIKEYIKTIALHEIIELLLMPLFFLADERYTTREQLEDARHSIIQTLQKVILNQ